MPQGSSAVRPINGLLLTILTRNFSKEQSVLPEDDRRIEICRGIVGVLM